MANVVRITYKIKLSRQIPVVKMVMYKIDSGGGSGDTNVIEVIKRNGTTLTVSNKTVNIVVPEASTDLTDSEELLRTDNATGSSVSSGNTKLVNGGQVYAAIQNATDTTNGVGSGNTNLVSGGQVYTAIQNAIANITDGDSEEY